MKLLQVECQGVKVRALLVDQAEGGRDRIARASLVDAWAGLVALACLAALVRFKVDASLVVVAAGVTGLILR